MAEALPSTDARQDTSWTRALAVRCSALLGGRLAEVVRPDKLGLVGQIGVGGGVGGEENATKALVEPASRNVRVLRLGDQMPCAMLASPGGAGGKECFTNAVSPGLRGNAEVEKHGIARLENRRDGFGGGRNGRATDKNSGRPDAKQAPAGKIKTGRPGGWPALGN